MTTQELIDRLLAVQEVGGICPVVIERGEDLPELRAVLVAWNEEHGKLAVLQSEPD